jgi:hypothetical protein
MTKDPDPLTYYVQLWVNQKDPQIPDEVKKIDDKYIQVWSYEFKKSKKPEDYFKDLPRCEFMWEDPAKPKKWLKKGYAIKAEPGINPPPNFPLLFDGNVIAWHEVKTKKPYDYESWLLAVEVITRPKPPKKPMIFTIYTVNWVTKRAKPIVPKR